MADATAVSVAVFTSDDHHTELVSWPLHVDTIKGGITRSPVLFGLPSKAGNAVAPNNPYNLTPIAWGLDLGMIQEYVEVSGTCNDVEKDSSFATISDLTTLARVAGAGMFGSVSSSKFGGISSAFSTAIVAGTGPGQGMAQHGDLWTFPGLVLSFTYTRDETSPKLAYNYNLRVGVVNWQGLIVHPNQPVMPPTSSSRTPISLDVLTSPTYDNDGHLNPQSVISSFNLKATRRSGGITRMPVYFGLPNIHDNQADPYKTEPSAWGLDLGMIQEYVEIAGLCADDEPDLSYANMTDLMVAARVCGAGLHSTIDSSQNFNYINGRGVGAGGAVNLYAHPEPPFAQTTYPSLITSLTWQRSPASFQGYDWAARFGIINWSGLILPPVHPITLP